MYINYYYFVGIVTQSEMEKSSTFLHFYWHFLFFFVYWIFGDLMNSSSKCLQHFSFNFSPSIKLCWEVSQKSGKYVIPFRSTSPTIKLLLRRLRHVEINFIHPIASMSDLISTWRRRNNEQTKRESERELFSISRYVTSTRKVDNSVGSANDNYWANRSRCFRSNFISEIAKNLTIGLVTSQFFHSLHFRNTITCTRRFCCLNFCSKSKNSLAETIELWRKSNYLFSQLSVWANESNVRKCACVFIFKVNKQWNEIKEERRIIDVSHGLRESRQWREILEQVQQPILIMYYVYSSRVLHVTRARGLTSNAS